MKNALTIMVLVTSVYTTFAQRVKDSEVPVAVKTAFQGLYPKATEVKWDKESSNYEASFDLSKVDNSVLLDNSGKVLETEVEIGIDQLPHGIMGYIKANYKGKALSEGAKITDSAGTVTYEAGIKGMDLLFDSTGKFIKENKN